ncbi:hypothetical protein CDAR_391481 [Caerostris darwini]|uniref:Uncharacterized protein n=1 Tax=Caerostris darwini TaxID=1538125 RepID=A0AAV4NFY8_9ARAC|nr:hypothetical protein CDAR_391481 [Caerostris darwini]
MSLTMLDSGLRSRPANQEPPTRTQLLSSYLQHSLCCRCICFCTSGIAVGYGYGPFEFGNVRFGVANYQQELAGGAVRGYNGQLVPFCNL